MYVASLELLMEYCSHIFSHYILFFQCQIQNISGTNVTTVNGQVVESYVTLNDGDVFCLGLRQFTYQNGGDVSFKFFLSSFTLKIISLTFANLQTQIKKHYVIKLMAILSVATFH